MVPSTPRPGNLASAGHVGGIFEDVDNVKANVCRVGMLALWGVVLGLAGPTWAQERVLRPGNERAAKALLGGAGEGQRQFGAWTLDTIAVGPDCAIRLRFQSQDSVETTVALTPRQDNAQPGTPSFAIAFLPTEAGCCWTCAVL